MLTGGILIASWDKLIAYCRIAMGHEKVEQFRLLFLNKKAARSASYFICVNSSN